MKAMFFATLLVLAAPLAAAAQESPRVEVFGGFSYLHDADEDGSPIFPVDRSLTGFEVSGAFNLTDWFGVEAGVSRHAGSNTTDLVLRGAPLANGGFTPDALVRTTQDSSVTSFLAGPRVALPGNRVRPFAHALFGTTTGDLDVVITTTGPIGDPGFNFPQNDRKTSFAFAVGGGLDVGVTDSIAVRVIQADYVRGGESFGSIPRNTARLSAGVVIRFGER